MRKYLRALHSNLCRVGVLDIDVDMQLEYLTVCNKLSLLFHKSLGIGLWNFLIMFT